MGYRPQRGSERLGFALGVGAVFVATLGVYWRSWQPATPAWLWVSGSLALGTVLTLALLTWRDRRR